MGGGFGLIPPSRHCFLIQYRGEFFVMSNQFAHLWLLGSIFSCSNITGSDKTIIGLYSGTWKIKIYNQE